MSRTVHRGKADASNVVPFPAHPAPVVPGWWDDPEARHAFMRRVSDAWINTPISQLRLPPAPRSPHGGAA